MILLSFLNGHLFKNMRENENKINKSTTLSEIKKIMSKSKSFSTFLGILSESFELLNPIRLCSTPLHKSRYSPQSISSSNIQEEIILNDVEYNKFIYDINRKGTKKYIFEKFIDGVVKSIHLSKKRRHIVEQDRTPRACVLCSEKSVNTTKHSPRTRLKWSVCSVHLCKYCFPIFHLENLSPTRKRNRRSSVIEGNHRIKFESFTVNVGDSSQKRVPGKRNCSQS